MHRVAGALRGGGARWASRVAADVEYSELSRRLCDGDIPLLVDVRESGEVAGGSIPGAVHIALGDVPAALDLDPTAFEARYGIAKPGAGVEVVVYCRSGVRSAHAAAAMCQFGWAARNYRGSWLEWSALHGGE